MNNVLNTKRDFEAEQSGSNRCEDPYIKAEQLSRLAWGTHALQNDILVTVEDGWVTLEGEVPCCLRKSQLPRFSS